MKALDLVTIIEGIVQDPSYKHKDFLAYLNRGVTEIAGLVQLPLLLSSSTVTTVVGTPYTALPTDYHRELHFVVSNATGNRIPYERSSIKFLKKYVDLTKTGTIETVTIRGNNLYYQYIPTTPDTLTLYYFRKPTPCDFLTQVEPDGIPEHLQEQLLVPYVCWKVFDQIEDGIADAKTNTNSYRQRFSEAMAELKLFLGPEDGEPEYIEDEGMYTYV